MFSWRMAGPADRPIVMDLLEAGGCVHVHLDWKPVEAWLGAQPFLIAEQTNRAVGLLVCPPDIPGVAWVRGFVCRHDVDPAAVWGCLWPVAMRHLAEMEVRLAAALSVAETGWLETLCLSSGFALTESVVVLSRTLADVSPPERLDISKLPPLSIRPAASTELAELMAIDHAAFDPLWRLSAEMIYLAFIQADRVGVAETADRQLAGYYLCTGRGDSAHLARLAVRPQYWRQGIGTAMVEDVVRHYSSLSRHDRRPLLLTVNTQSANVASLAVYRRVGFELDGRRYPVLTLAIQ